MTGPSFIEQAAAFIEAAQPDAAAIGVATEALTDYVGVALAGSREPVSRNILKWSEGRSSGWEAGVIGHGVRLDVELAALCNGVAGHALDFDDTSWATIGHPTTVVAPAAFAIGERMGATGYDVVTAYLVGVEVAHRLAGLSMPETSQNGWHTTGVFYALGAAAAACRLLRLTPTVARHAMALSLSHASGIRANFGTQTKPYHAGMAARKGLEAVSLAVAGITASAHAVEGADGFIRCFAGDTRYAQSQVGMVPLGEPYDLVTRGLAYKRYPCCSGSHPACDLLLDLVAKHRLAPGQVAEIWIGASLLSERELICHDPQTPTEARFSMEFVLAAALARRSVTLDSFTAETLADPEIRRLMALVRMSISPKLARLGFVGNAPVEMEIALTDGRVIAGERDLAVGNPERPMSARDRHAKFASCAERVMAPAAAESLYQQVSDISEAASFRQLLKRMAVTDTAHIAQAKALASHDNY